MLPHFNSIHSSSFQQCSNPEMMCSTLLSDWCGAVLPFWPGNWASMFQTQEIAVPVFIRLCIASMPSQVVPSRLFPCSVFQIPFIEMQQLGCLSNLLGLPWKRSGHHWCVCTGPAISGQVPFSPVLLHEVSVFCCMCGCCPFPDQHWFIRYSKRTTVCRLKSTLLLPLAKQRL